MMFMPFLNEAVLFEDDSEKCQNLFEDCDDIKDGNNPELTKI